VKAKTLISSFLLPAALLWGSDTKPVFNLPAATHAKTYPAHESHDDERVSIAIDPFDFPEKAAIFKVNYKQNGFLPIRLIISNDADKIVMLNDLKILYITVKRDKIEPATTDDIYRRVLHLKRNPSSPRVPLPVPIPRDKSPITNEAKIAVDELDQAQFVPHPIEPHSIRSGFLFFDITDVDPPEAGAHLYISGLRVGGKELFYFDIPLEKYLSHRPGT
jgi:hypothetical protein